MTDRDTLPSPSPPPPHAGVDAELVEAIAADVETLVDSLESVVDGLRGLVSTMRREAAAARPK